MFHVKQKTQITFSMFHVKHYFPFPSKTTELLCQKYSHQHFLGIPHDIFWGSLQLSISTSFCPYGLANRCLPTVSPKPPPILSFFRPPFPLKLSPFVCRTCPMFSVKRKIFLRHKMFHVKHFYRRLAITDHLLFDALPYRHYNRCIFI